MPAWFAEHLQKEFPEVAVLNLTTHEVSDAQICDAEIVISWLLSEQAVKAAIFPYATEKGRSTVLWPLRVALSGREKSPDPFVIASFIGREKTLARIASAVHSLESL